MTRIYYPKHQISHLLPWLTVHIKSYQWTDGLIFSFTEPGGAGASPGGAGAEDAISPQRLDLRVGKIINVQKVSGWSSVPTIP